MIINTRAALERHLSTLDDSPVAHVVVDAAGVIRATNTAFARLFGCAAPVTGSSFLDVVAVVREEPFWHGVSSCCEAVAPLTVDLDIDMPAGRRRTFQAVATPLRTHEGTQSIVALVDVGERARVEAWLQAVIDKMPECVMISDPSGNVIANEKARPFSTAGDTGAPRFDMRTPDGRIINVDQMPLERALRGERVSDLDLVLHAHDRDMPVLVSAAPIIAPCGERRGAVCLCRDVTGLRRVEKLREEWAAIVAHDMRQPLSVIRLSDELLSKSIPQGDPTVRRAVERIRISARRMWAMLEELVDTSLIEARRLRIAKAPMCLATCAREVIMHVPSQEHEIVLDVPEGLDTVVPADEGRIEQVLGNLLTNACKYAEPQTPVLVRLRRTAHEMRVSVDNRGRDIPTSELASLFSRFVRTHAAASSPSRGLGLGLYIVRGLVNAHGGEVRASSNGGVTTFEFTLPVV